MTAPLLTSDIFTAAACRDMPPEYFTDMSLRRNWVIAKKTCRTCPIKTACRAFADATKADDVFMAEAFYVKGKRTDDCLLCGAPIITERPQFCSNKCLSVAHRKIKKARQLIEKTKAREVA